MAQLPGPTQFMLDIGDFTRRYCVLVLAALGVLLWLDAKLFERLYRRHGRRVALVYLWGLAGAMVIIPCVLMVLGMILPLLLMGEVVEG